MEEREIWRLRPGDRVVVTAFTDGSYPGTVWQVCYSPYSFRPVVQVVLDEPPAGTPRLQSISAQFVEMADVEEKTEAG